MNLRERSNFILDYKRVPRDSKENHWDKVVSDNRKSVKAQKANRSEMKKWKQNANAFWEIEDIIDEKIEDSGELKVLIKWRNWPDKYNSWEPIENLNDDYHKVLQKLREERAKTTEKNESKEEALKSKIKIEAETTKKTKKITKVKDKTAKKPVRSAIARQSRAPKKQKDAGWANIEDILDEKEMKGQTYFLIKWQGWPVGDSTWEPRENLAAVDIEKLKERLQQEKRNPACKSEPIKIRITRDMQIEDGKPETNSENTHIQEKSLYPPWNMGLGKNLKNIYNLYEKRIEDEGEEEDIIDDGNDDEDDRSSYQEWVSPTDRKKRIADIKNHLNTVKFQMKQNMFEQEINTMRRGPTSEDMMNEYKEGQDAPLQDLLVDFDKKAFTRKIVKHKMNSDGEFYEFCVSEWNQSNKYKFWISLAEAREKYSLELIGFLMDFTARQQAI